MDISATRERKKRKQAYKGHSGVEPEHWFLGRENKEKGGMIMSETKPINKTSQRINIIPETGLYVDNKTGSVLSYENLNKRSNEHEKMSIKIGDFFIGKNRKNNENRNPLQFI